ncbi:porin [Sphaerotilus sp.]|uniref:porin n=1 Tax=Sphaerotilus sp. TaxID=2093942 RepID=UPI002ACE0E29|nr:porin [Sphaerotilus sp.]MDZ7856634.1 porin [Sphaerotilus sp.]
MKKSLLALAVLGAFAGAASAQSSVTLYGKVDLGVGKAAGTTDKAVMDGSGSRVGVRGVEDLGGGMRALFGFEHRFSPDTGAQAGAVMWNGYSTVGLGGAFGTVNLGRQYTAAFILAQNAFDPFGGDTVGGLRGASLTGTVARIRTQNSLRYDGTFGGLKVAADIAELEAGGVDRPYSVAVQYAAGPLLAAVGYDNPTGANDNLLTAGVGYTFGPARLTAAIGAGDTNANAKIKQALLGASVNVGAGRVLLGYAQQKLGTAATTKKSSIGYRHNLSKRTQLYTDISRVNTGTEKNAYDFGVLHTF